MADLWKKALLNAQNSSKRSVDILNYSGDGKGFRMGTLRQYDQLRIDQDSVTDSVQAKMIDDSLRRTYRAIRRISTVDSINDTENRRGRTSQDPKPGKLSEIIAEARRVSKNNNELLEILEEIKRSNASESIEMQQLAQQLSIEEAGLRNRMVKAQQQVKEVEQEMPTADGSASEFAQQAKESMDSAEDSLAKGSSMTGEGYQRNAADRVRDTIDALEQQMQQMQQMQQQMQEMSEGPGEQDDMPEPVTMDVPSPEDFMTPEEYRRLLLDGMTGEVPEEFQSLKKRYYEELVTQ
jgi:flagellar hook-basal body complex protein FliE